MEPKGWDIRRDGRRWTKEEFERRIYQVPEKIEFVGGIFANDRQRLTVLAMLLENLGIDKVVRFGNLDDWKEALSDRTSQQTQPLSCSDVLKIAHDDAQRANRDLTGYRITLVREPDGWHVDYDLTTPYMAGGGPHYVIDPDKGSIVSKRYEQ